MDTPSTTCYPAQALEAWNDDVSGIAGLGASAKVALLVAKNSRRWWHNSRLALNKVLTIAYFDRLGMPRLS
jgi:hypothetical protein